MASFDELEALRRLAAGQGWKLETAEVWHGARQVFGLYNLTRTGRSIGPMKPERIRMFLLATLAPG
jgi:hypothetical protein